MREIKFRFWIKADKEIKYDLSTAPQESINELFKARDIIPMQYTGLKDKNGKEIYEGDIVDYSVIIDYGDDPDYYEKGVVGFEKGMFVIKNDNYSFVVFPDRPLHLNSEIEVIGNIYENPELLK